MNLKNTLKILGIILVFVVLQSYFTNPERFVAIIENWKDYFMTIIMSIFIAILLEPIVKYLKKKSKINDILAISLSIIFVILVFIILSLIVIPEIISSLKVLNDIYPYISEKAITIGKNIANYLAEKNIYTINMDEVNNYFTNFISNNTTNITKLASSLLGSLVDWTIGFTNLFLAFVLAFLILLDKKHLIKTLENIIKIIFGVKNTPYIMNKLSLSKNIFLGYVSGKIIGNSWIMCLCNLTHNRNSLCCFKCYSIRHRKYDSLCWFNYWGNNSIFLNFISSSNKNYYIIGGNSNLSIS